VTRKHLRLKTKLAAALLTLGDVKHEHAKLMTEDQICSLYQFDHWPVRHADGGTDHPSNLTPRLIKPHREKSKHDASDRTKERRVRRAQAAHDDALMVKSADPGSVILSALKPMQWTRWSSRPFPKRQRGFGR
jgi:hypothetical protein